MRGGNFELSTALAILVLFEQCLGKFCLDFLLLHLSASPNNAFCLYIFDYACLGHKAYCSGKG